MSEADRQRRYREEARLLGQLGSFLARAKLHPLPVRLPRSLAEKAVAAWERDDAAEPTVAESYEQRIQRHRAGTLALIGSSIAERGRWEGDAVLVELAPDLVGIAIDAGDDEPPQGDSGLKIGACCKELADAMNQVPNSFFRLEDDGTFMLTVGYLHTGQETGWFDQAVIYCPFCGSMLQDRDEVQARHQS